ncbi:uncharacterized protein LOC107624629 [Arachis ipaensis]|uniref:uncharacterized protein LOC107624629 n=1 Tax=Arachis ipaensis TaxID=130454 RepID=UPI0007AF4B6C|nr:uncharacterized protein LOC107624629 [Arachis ipaensis]
MAVADNTRMKGMEADIKRLFQMIETVSEENRTERARASEAADLKLNAIQSSLAQLLNERPHDRSPSGDSRHGSNSGYDPFTRNGPHLRRVNFDLPKFNGSDALGWIFSLDQYFEFFRVPEEEQLAIAAIHMTGMVIPWYQMSQRSAPFRSWAQLKREIELEFGPSLFESPQELLFKLQQQGSVGDYYAEFVALANRTNLEPHEALRDCFVSGLRLDIRREVKAQCPPSLMRAVTLARLYEDKFATVPRTTYGPNNFSAQQASQNPSTPQRPTSRNSLPPLLPTPNQRPSTSNSKNFVKRLSPAKIQIRREKGLCFWCDEKFSASHKCANKHLMLLQLAGEDDPALDDLGELVQSESAILEQLEQDVVAHHLSYNAMHGTKGPSTIRLKAMLNGLEVQVLIDGGSSDSFIQPRIAKFLNLPVEPCLGFKVVVGDFDVLTVEGCISKIDIHVQGCKITIPEVYVLHVAGGDMVIGTTWLETLKTHIVDYDSSFLRFLHQGKFVTIRGDKTLAPAQAQFHHIRRLAQTDSIAEAFTLQVHKADNKSINSLELPENMDPALMLLLHKYATVFDQPVGLPPQRAQDHSIPLIQGAEPVKVRPYRVPHSQKEQIEVMVQQMLHEGIIQPSNSPFSSPILLVKKKDGTWRFCTDYRALNKITVKDSFPIPTVEELLDELFGATFFSKLDLRSG